MIRYEIIIEGFSKVFYALGKFNIKLNRFNIKKGNENDTLFYKSNVKTIKKRLKSRRFFSW